VEGDRRSHVTCFRVSLTQVLEKIGVGLRP
jgi:hypothetical protein